jgi:hypothetical protein
VSIRNALFRLIFILLGVCLVPAPGWSGENPFRYGFVAKFSTGDNAVLVEDGATLKSGTQFKVNLSYPAVASMYVLHLSPKQVYSLLYIPKDIKGSPSDNHFDTSGWHRLGDETGDEVFYLIGSSARLIEFQQALKRYTTSTGERRARFHQRIDSLVKRYSRAPPGTSTRLAQRLDRPVLGTVVFRGAKGQQDLSRALTHQLSGNDVMAAKFVIRHR